jgi:hypothetical protein
MVASLGPRPWRRPVRGTRAAAPLRVEAEAGVWRRRVAGGGGLREGSSGEEQGMGGAAGRQWMDREELRKGGRRWRSGRGAGRLEAAELLKIGRQTRVSQLFI